VIFIPFPPIYIIKTPSHSRLDVVLSANTLSVFLKQSKLFRTSVNEVLKVGMLYPPVLANFHSFEATALDIVIERSFGYFQDRRDFFH